MSYIPGRPFSVSKITHKCSKAVLLLRRRQMPQRSRMACAGWFFAGFFMFRIKCAPGSRAHVHGSRACVHGSIACAAKRKCMCGKAEVHVRQISMGYAAMNKTAGWRICVYFHIDFP